MKIASFAISLLLLVGCASPSSPRAKATSSCLAVYGRIAGISSQVLNDYPKQLDDLRPKYCDTDVPWHGHYDLKYPWFLWYERKDQDNYTIYLDTIQCSQAVFKNGTFVATASPFNTTDGTCNRERNWLSYVFSRVVDKAAGRCGLQWPFQNRLPPKNRTDPGSTEAIQNPSPERVNHDSPG